MWEGGVGKKLDVQKVAVKIKREIKRGHPA